MTDILIHIVDTGPKITAYPVTTATAYIVGQRVLTPTGRRLYECITAGTSSGGAELTSQLADVTDGTVHWHYLCTQSYANLAELSADYGVGLTLDLPGSLEKHLIWIWDKGAVYLGDYNTWARFTSNHSVAYHQEFDVPGPSNIPTDFIGVWDLATGDSFVEQQSGGALGPDTALGASQGGNITHDYHNYYVVFRRIIITWSSQNQTFMGGINVANGTFENLIIENTNIYRLPQNYRNMVERLINAQNCIIIDHGGDASYTIRDTCSGWKNCLIIKPSNLTANALAVISGDSGNPGWQNVAILGFAALTNPFPNEPVSPSGWTWNNCLSDIPLAVLNAKGATLTNCYFGETFSASSHVTNATITTPLDLTYVGATNLIDTGLGTGAPATDIFGQARVGTIDIGAYEYQVGAPAYALNQSNMRGGLNFMNGGFVN